MSVFNPVGGIVWAAPDAVTNFNWINLISGGLTTLGLPINTGVSGQINLGTGSIAIPGSIVNGTIYPMGYEVRQMISPGLTTLQVRIDYKLIAVGTTAAGLWPIVVITVGTTVNATTGVVGGAFTTGGASTGNNTTVYTTTASTLPRSIFMSSDGANYFTMVIDPGRTVAAIPVVPANIVLDRSITAATGAYNNAGYQLMSVSSAIVSGADGSGVWNVNLSSNVCTYAISYPSTFPGILFTSSGTGSAATVAPVSVMLPAPQGPMLGCIGYFNSDVAAGNTFPVLIYGANHTYLACGVSYISFAQSPTTAGSLVGFGAQRLAMRYE